MLPAAGRAQSLTTGTLTGIVRDGGGALLPDAGVTLIDRVTGTARSVLTPRGGQFAFTLVPPGEYDLLVERVAYRPRRVRGIPVLPGANLDVPVSLVAAPPPVSVIDTVEYHPGATLSTPVGVSGWLGASVFADLSGDRREVTNVAGLSTVSTGELQGAGLPERFSGIMIDGVPHVPARHPALGAVELAGAAFPLSALGRTELLADAGDVEWAGFGGGILSGFTQRGAPVLTLRASGDFAGDAQRGGVLVSGPVVRDTAQFAVGVEARHLEASLPSPWRADAVAQATVDLARDSFGLDLSGYLRPRITITDILSAFGRFDWQIAPGHALVVRGSVASATVSNPELGVAARPSLGSSLDATDVSAAAALTSRLSPSLASEFRFSVDASTREYQSDTIASTTIMAGGLAFGGAEVLPGRFKRTTVRVSETVHYTHGAHQLKVGLGLLFDAHDHTYTDGRGGAFVFADTLAFAQRRGVFMQAVGSLPVAIFKTPVTSFYFQDLWAPMPGLAVILGGRLERVHLPGAEVRHNTDWDSRTGLDNRNIPPARTSFSPRIGFEWSAGAAQEWVVRGGAGVYLDAMEPADLAELITHNGAVQERRGIGALGRWPAPPDTTGAPFRAPALTLLHPEFGPPRTGRLSLGISRALPSRLTLHVQGVYRHTDYLPRRRDLNLLPAPTARDQYGRAVFGALTQLGEIVSANPGSNRRFTTFDLVSALDQDGYSDYYGATLALERNALSGLSFIASYTYSRTTDNWLAARGGGPESQLSPFPDSVSGKDWTEGRSDFDVPHRVMVGVELRSPRRSGFHIAVLYRYRSGYPFTPGFRDGVDANGDGSARNDPAFVDDTILGVDALIARFDCLRGEIGRFAARNACREAGARRVDLRVGLRIATLRGYPMEVVLDGLNLMSSDVGIVDRALYLVNPDFAPPAPGTLAPDPNGVVTVPLVVNPDFGRLLVRRTAQKVWRLGLRVNY
ncbi:MAG: TonB-dependent receptor [Gemmatimonadetes bacterium]|nr:TonB-dependent receptor [Gemmatimonadota bacterium]